MTNMREVGVLTSQLFCKSKLLRNKRFFFRALIQGPHVQSTTKAKFMYIVFDPHNSAVMCVDVYSLFYNKESESQMSKWPPEIKNICSGGAQIKTESNDHFLL